MRIENFITEKGSKKKRVAATVIWEDCDLPNREVFFETENEFAQGLVCNPQAFLIGSIMPAMHHGERRIFIEADICPELKDGLVTAMLWLRHWYYGANKALVRIDAGTMSLPPSAPPQERAGLFFSGGVDCLGVLRYNRLNYPPEHPGFLRDGLIIYGQNVESDIRPEVFAQALTSLSEIAQDCGLKLIPVYTNIRELDEDKHLFTVNHGAILGAVAHAFSGRLTTAIISSSHSIPALAYCKRQHMVPYGSSPLVDPNFSSCGLKVRHEGISLSRLDKVKLLADWDLALQNIKVCGPNWPGENCGVCEKCVRTMLELLAAGALKKATSFPADDVTEELVKNITINKQVVEDVKEYYLELIAAFEQGGRHGLAWSVKELLQRSQNPKFNLKKSIKRFDEKFLKGNIHKIKGLSQMDSL